MQEINLSNKPNFEVVCRTCLIISDQFYPLFEVESEMQISFADILRTFTNLHIQHYDEFPQQICNTCKESIINTYKFKLQAEKCEQILWEYKTNQNINDNSLIDNELSVSNNVNTSVDDIIFKEEVSNYFKTEATGFIEETIEGETIEEKTIEQQSSTIKEIFLKNEPTSSVEVKTTKRKSRCKSDNNVTGNVDKSKKHPCEICGKCFPKPSKLKRHMETHGFKSLTKRPDGKQLCMYCGKRVSHINAHIRRHTGVKPFKCDQCGSAFARDSDLKRHIRSHTGERPHLCKFCGKGFAQSDKLKCHLRIHTGERPYKCTHCDQAFILAKDLTHHVRRHTGEKPHECGDCGKRFIQKTALRTHCKSQGHCYEKCINHEKITQATLLIRTLT